MDLAYANGNPNTRQPTQSNAILDTDPFSNAHHRAYVHSNTDRHADPKANGNSYPNADADTDAQAQTNAPAAHSYTDSGSCAALTSRQSWVHL